MLFEQSQRANKYANTLGPILNNIGNVLYVVVALAGGILMVYQVPNVSISGLPLSISVVVPFLNMAKQFAGNVNQVSNQVNSVVMGLAGTSRIMETAGSGAGDRRRLCDPGQRQRRKRRADGVRGAYRPVGLAASHKADGTVTYTKLTGDVRLFDVDFEYEKGKTVLHNITLYAEPGQKVAFVGATGAGKTTITNLLNRFYDIADGKIRYDGININKIKKADLRRSLGIVLQDTNPVYRHGYGQHPLRKAGRHR